jgi:hypothetical protein
MPVPMMDVGIMMVRVPDRRVMMGMGVRLASIPLEVVLVPFGRRDQDGEERWWLEVLGKGDKLRIIPAMNELMVELARYRRELSSPPYPVPGESTPLLLPIGGNRGH